MAILWITLVLITILLACAISCVAVLRLTMGRPYPSFLAPKRWPARDAVPVIMYHEVTPEHFANELRYLKTNGYETITADALTARLNGENVSLPKRPIVLTFDDGLESLWSVAYPTLKEFGYHAIAYVCPFWIERGPALRPSLARSYTRSFGWATWNQLREMNDSGIIDVQSHTLAHHCIWIDPTVVDFMKPGLELPLIWYDDTLAPNDQALPPLGWPVLAHCQRFNSPRRFIPDRTVMQACADHVAAHGNEAFFRRENWCDELRKLLPSQDGHCRIPGRFETPDEQRETLRQDLETSKQQLEERLDKRIEHLAFPRNEASTLAATLAAEVGYRSAVRGPVNDRDICQLGDDPMCIPRANSGGPQGQFVLSLPGQGRRGPERVFAAKLLARIRRNRPG